MSSDLLPDVLLDASGLFAIGADSILEQGGLVVRRVVPVGAAEHDAFLPDVEVVVLEGDPSDPRVGRLLEEHQRLRVIVASATRTLMSVFDAELDPSVPVLVPQDDLVAVARGVGCSCASNLPHTF